MLAFAQIEAQSNQPKQKVAYLRFWNMLPPGNGTFDLRRLGAPPSEGMIAGKVPAYRYASYQELTPGVYTLGVFKSGEEKTPLRTLNVPLKPDSFFTVLVMPGDVQVIDDTPDPKATSATLVIRNFYPGLTVSVSTDSGMLVDGLAYGATYQATGLPSKRLPLVLKTKLPNGTEAESGAEADFVASKRGTLLVIPDSYGRFRPRVTIDGKNL